MTPRAYLGRSRCWKPCHGIIDGLRERGLTPVGLDEMELVDPAEWAPSRELDPAGSVTWARGCGAAAVASPSHVSLESALAHHGLIPEAVQQTSSVTAHRSRSFTTDLGV